MTNTNVISVVSVAHILHDSDKDFLNFNYITHTATRAINVCPDLTEGISLMTSANHVHHSTCNTRANYPYYSIT